MNPQEPLVDAAILVISAAMKLAQSASDPDRDRYLCVAKRLGLAIQAEPTRPILLAASPRVVDRSGRIVTLLEMIEMDPGDDEARGRLAALLMRALIWKVCDEEGSRELFRHHGELTCHQRRKCMHESA